MADYGGECRAHSIQVRAIRLLIVFPPSSLSPRPSGPPRPRPRPPLRSASLPIRSFSVRFPSHRLFTSTLTPARAHDDDAMRFSGFSLASLPALALALCLLLASSPAEALSIPPSLKAPPRVKSVRATDGWTNAKRLAAGLPPRAPRTFKRATPTVPDPYAPVKRSAPSPSPSPFAFARPYVPRAICLWLVEPLLTIPRIVLQCGGDGV